MKTRNLLYRVLTALLIFSSFLAGAQVQTARYVSMNPSTNGYYEYLPQGYNPAASTTYPLILFVHGLGETGPGNTTTLPNVLRNGIPRVINEGKFPTSFTVNGVTSKFIVISPQFNVWPKFTDVDAVLDYIEAHYKIDRTRVYVTGLSMGGGVTWEYGGCSSNLKYVQRVAAIVPICGASSPSAYRARTIAKYNLPVWALHNQNDPTVSVETTNQYIALINEPPAPVPPAKKTIFNASGHDAWTRAYDPNYRENNMNVYEWMLQYSRPAQGTNPPPVVNAGADKSITLPVNSVALSGSATDANGTISSYAWTRVSGPTQFTFSNTSVANPTVSNLVAGTYVFRLTATDNGNASAYDDITITVNAAVNTPPVANAGADKTITLPVSSVALTGSGTDADGSVSAYAWTKTSGPSSFTFSNAAVASPTVSNLVAGIYVFRLTVTDNNGATAYDEARVTVNAAANTPPVANAGADKSITLPVNSVSLSGSGSDADGSVSSYTWSKTAGPAQFSFSSTTVAGPTVSNLTAGTYTFRLTVTDNAGASAYDDVNVVVAPAPVTYFPVPGKIEAEAYAQMNGVQSETTQDAGGGLNIGWIEAGDWMDYNVNVAATGSYTLNLRMAAPSANSQVQLRKADGTVLASLTVPATGSWQSWTTISATVALTGGNQVLRIYAPTSGWNLNWFEFTAVVTPPPATAKSINVKLFAGTNPYNNAEWNNWTYSSTSAALKYSDGSSSTVKVSLDVPGNMADNGPSYVGGIAPAGALRHASYATVRRTLTISGLSPAKTYDIELYASRANNPGNNTLFTCTGLTQTVSTYNNSTQKAVFSNRTADENGNIIVTVDRVNTYNYLNSFKITERDGSQGLTASRGAVAAGPADNAGGGKELGIYPNPFVDQLILQLNNKHTGLMNVSLIDPSGRIIRQLQYNKPQELFNQVVSVGDLQPGLYLIKVQIGKWSETRKIVRN